MDNSTHIAFRAQRWIVSLLFSSFLTGEPRGSRGSMIGVINGQKFGAAILNTSVQQEARSGVTTIRSSISHIPASVGEWGSEDALTPAESKPKWVEVRTTSSPPCSPKPNKITAFKISPRGTCLVARWLRLHAPNAGGQSSIPGQGTRSWVLQLRPGAARYIFLKISLREHEMTGFI